MSTQRLIKGKRPIIDYGSNKYTTFGKEVIKDAQGNDKVIGKSFRRDKYQLCYVPYNATELRGSKDGKTHHVQLIAKRNLEENTP